MTTFTEGRLRAYEQMMRNNGKRNERPAYPKKKYQREPSSYGRSFSANQKPGEDGP